MTREEHIIYAKNLRVALNMTNAFSAETMESLDTAIKALEQKSNDDCVSRQVAIDYLYTNMAWYDENGSIADDSQKLRDITNLVNGIPSVTPTQRWIPVSERLPEEMGTYMTTIDYGEHGLATGQRYYYGQGLWEDDCVIAWMPLPEPYKAESEG